MRKRSIFKQKPELHFDASPLQTIAAFSIFFLSFLLPVTVKEIFMGNKGGGRVAGIYTSSGTTTDTFGAQEVVYIAGYILFALAIVFLTVLVVDYLHKEKSTDL